jgi:hypothetical protein
MNDISETWSESMEEYKKFIEMAVELGANGAKMIKTDNIVTAAWVRWMCK